MSIKHISVPPLSPSLSFIIFLSLFLVGSLTTRWCGRCGEVVGPTIEEQPKADDNMTDAWEESV